MSRFTPLGHSLRGCLGDRAPTFKTRLWLGAVVAGLLLVVAVVSFLPTPSLAAWPLDGAGIGTAANVQSVPKAISDGAAGAIIAWQDNRTGTNHVYMQRIDAIGVAKWTPNGVVISTSSGDSPQLIPDGNGGAIVAWGRNGDIYAQHVNASGSAIWMPGGVLVSAATGAQQLPTLVSDGAGGAIICWQDSRTGTDYDIYAQRIDPAGDPQWTANGNGVCVLSPSNQSEPQIVADGSGGAIIVWPDTRNGLMDIYVQRVNYSGSMLWTGNGVGLCTASEAQGDPQIAADGSGGAIVAWEDSRTFAYDLYARRINGAGTPQWASNGVAIAALTNYQWNPTIMADGSGGAFIGWEDSRNGLSDIYVQRVNSAGTSLWAVSGVALGTLGSSASEPSIVTDGLGGAIVAWQDSRSGNVDIYARRINGSGVAQWTANGVALSSAAGVQDNTTIASDGLGGAIVAWEDARAGNDVYAQRIERNGYWGYPSPEIARVSDVPGDQGGQINVSWDASRIDPWPDEAIDTYTVWRSLSPSAAAAAIAAGAEVWRDRTDPAASGHMNTIRVQEINQATYYWQLIHTVAAYGIAGYSDIVPTPFDSTLASPQALYFQVIAHAAVGQWVSQPASGRSLDNIAPAPPLQLAAQRVGADVHLVWNQNEETDLRNYAVYRKSAAGVTPIPPNFLSDAEDTVLVDASAPATSLYYIVTAIDEHYNQSTPSNEAAVSPVTGVGDTPQQYVLSVSNYPNPFNPRTTVSYTVPSRGVVSIVVYDAHGGRVATLFHGERDAGAYSIEWDGRAATGATVSSGVYFARIEHASGTRSKKMVLLK